MLMEKQVLDFDDEGNWGAELSSLDNWGDNAQTLDGNPEGDMPFDDRLTVTERAVDIFGQSGDGDDDWEAFLEEEKITEDHKVENVAHLALVDNINEYDKWDDLPVKKPGQKKRISVLYNRRGNDRYKKRRRGIVRMSRKNFLQMVGRAKCSFGNDPNCRRMTAVCY